MRKSKAKARATGRRCPRSGASGRAAGKPLSSGKGRSPILPGAALQHSGHFATGMAGTRTRSPPRPKAERAPGHGAPGTPAAGAAKAPRRPARPKALSRGPASVPSVTKRAGAPRADRASPRPSARPQARPARKARPARLERAGRPARLERAGPATVRI